MNELLVGLCIAAGSFLGLLLPSLALTTPMVADLQVGICAVGSGRSNVALLGFDLLDDRGVGSLVVVVTSGTVFDQVVGPAIKARFGAMRPVS